MVEVFFEDSLYEIILNRPEKHNAFDAQMIQALTDAFKNTPQEARVVVIRANGKSFCAGADLAYMRSQVSSTAEENSADAARLSQMFEALYGIPVPTVLYAHGNVFGGGLGLVAASDIAIASDDARFCFSEVKLGIIPAVISPYVLKKTGTTFARRYFLTAEIFGSAEALSAGLIASAVAPEDVDIQIKRITEALLAASTEAQKSVKKLLRASEDFAPLTSDALANELARLRAGSDAQERIGRFLDKSLGGNSRKLS